MTWSVGFEGKKHEAIKNGWDQCEKNIALGYMTRDQASAVMSLAAHTPGTHLSGYANGHNVGEGGTVSASLTGRVQSE